MAAATANSRSCGSVWALVAIVFLLGLSVTLAQDNRFRISVYDDYQGEEPLFDYQEHQPDQGQNHRTNRGHSYQSDSRKSSSYRKPNPIYQKQNHEYRDPQQQQVQSYPAEQKLDYRTERYRNPYQKQYQQQLEEDYKNQAQTKPTPKKKPKKDGQDFSKIPGVPGVDYPTFHTIPKTSFSCAQVPYLPGMYANVETGCQVYHVCHDGREGDLGAAFLCSNGTLFNQNEFACDWWYNVKCHDSFRLYNLNGDAATNPFVPKAKQEAIIKGREIEQKLKIVVY